MRIGKGNHAFFFSMSVNTFGLLANWEISIRSGGTWTRKVVVVKSKCRQSKFQTKFNCCQTPMFVPLHFKLNAVQSEEKSLRFSSFFFLLYFSRRNSFRKISMVLVCCVRASRFAIEVMYLNSSLLCKASCHYFLHFLIVSIASIVLLFALNGLIYFYTVYDFIRIEFYFIGFKYRYNY